MLNCLVTETKLLIDLIYFTITQTSEGQKLDTGDMELVAKLLSWDKTLLFPCIDLARSINKTSPEFFQLPDKFKYVSRTFYSSL